MDYRGVYYVNAVTNEYVCYSVDNDAQALRIFSSGKDFFTDLDKMVDKVIFEEDRHIFKRDMTRTNFLLQLEKGVVKNLEYRYIADGEPVYYTLRLIKGPRKDHEYFVLGVKNIDDEVRQRRQAQTEAEDNTAAALDLATADMLRQNDIAPITEERKNILDRLFDALSVVSDGAYIFACENTGKNNGCIQYLQCPVLRLDYYFGQNSQNRQRLVYATLAEIIIHAVNRQQFKTDKNEFSVTMTVGLCECQPNDSIDSVISRADARLYKGKHSGKNCVVYMDRHWAAGKCKKLCCSLDKKSECSLRMFAFFYTNFI